MLPTQHPAPAPARLLPPLAVAGEPTGRSSSEGRRSTLASPARSPCSPQPPPERPPWSHYHRACVAEPRFGARAGNGSRLPRPVTLTAAGADTMAETEEQWFTRLVEGRRTQLERFVLERVSLAELRRWTAQKAAAQGRAQIPAARVNKLATGVGEGNSSGNVFLELLDSLGAAACELSAAAAVCARAARVAGAHAHRLYKVTADQPDGMQCFVVSWSGALPRLQRAVPAQATLALQAAADAICRRVSRPHHAFPDPPVELQCPEADHILYVPLLSSTGRAQFVAELWRARSPFSGAAERACALLQPWAAVALHFRSLYHDKARERNMSDFLLDVVKAIFEEMVSLDQLIKRILEFAQRLVNADRASLFLVDYRNFELVSTVFDLKFEPGQARDVEKKEIRMPINRGIAGHVALSGETMNIPDAYSDYRFNREVDEATGYKTMSILCMPIKVQGKVIGVVQMVNKRTDGSFHREDELAFGIFSTFFGLALHHARLYDRIMRKEQKYRVALEVLSYHNTCRENEVQDILRDTQMMDINLNDFYLDPYMFGEMEKCKGVIAMFNELFDLSKFDIMTLTRFVLTVKKNYRTVPYHNFDHGWSVAHSIYVMLKNDVRKRYNYKMRLALFVACLCHDLDHRGYTNKYMSESASPLASMYTTSTLEHHHFNITVTILQQDGHNIFAHMSGEEYKDVLGFIRHCILATDLAAFFPNLAKMKELQNAESSNHFSWANNSHRELAMALSMTAADLSASAKPWHVQLRTVRVIFEEFYDQGDKEREAGRPPIPMMDRNKPEQQPDSQVGFLSQICIPCYKVLYRILPKTKPMYVMALKNLHNWKAKANRVKCKHEYAEQADSSDIEDVPEEILLQGEPEIEEDDGQSDGEDQQTTVILSEVAAHQEDKIEEILRQDEREVLRGIEEDGGSWEEEENIESEEKIGGRLSRDIEGVSWIDEEGVVVRPNGAIKGYQNHGAKKMND